MFLFNFFNFKLDREARDFFLFLFIFYFSYENEVGTFF